ncbi:hypothetical protein BC938DRAFT_477404 [Jimgerdemannia flammicorona]|uniref:Uncharacterized protein n=1 Tax=Jimgerdemannia flammicorona TaxID=994334 RepID=A0A433QYU1_9FUNG|nr:hypothetical protein BC938DRAFT_477404 [Jimgerdemannia flammicorona]
MKKKKKKKKKWTTYILLQQLVLPDQPCLVKRYPAPLHDPLNFIGVGQAGPGVAVLKVLVQVERGRSQSVFDVLLEGAGVEEWQATVTKSLVHEIGDALAEEDHNWMGIGSSGSVGQLGHCEYGKLGQI